MAQEFMTGFVLAGGRSRRMGQDKAEIPWRGGTLLANAVEVMSEVSTHVYIVSSRQIQKPVAPVLADKVADAGPLAAIFTALSATETDWNLMLAVDLPLISPALLRFIAEACSRAQEQVVIPAMNGKLQTLCAAYHRSLLTQCEAALRNGDASVVKFVAGVPSRILEQENLAKHGFSADVFFNVNTPDDLIRAQELAESR
jgi:molybdopterin-guanine dinucleotide biosynthesis protein A